MDCQALVYLKIHKSVKPKIAQWYEILQEYDFDINPYSKEILHEYPLKIHLLICISIIYLK